MKLVIVLFFPVLVMAQTQSTPDLPLTGAPVKVVEPLKPAETKDNGKNLLVGIIEDYSYNPEGKRDPFAPYEATPQGNGAASSGMGPLFPLQKYELDQLKIVGIMWDVDQPKAMMLDPTGKSHVVKLNDRVGRNNGYIARIREGEIVIIESFKGVDGKVNYQSLSMKLSQE